VRYNSKLPLVIYAPTEVQVRYRIWSAAANATSAPQQ
jgi:ecotin